MSYRTNYVDEFLQDNGLEYEKWFLIDEFPGVHFMIDRYYRLNISDPTGTVSGTRIDFIYDNLLAGIYRTSAINEGMDYLRKIIGIKVDEIFNVVNGDGELVAAGGEPSRYIMKNDKIFYLNGKNTTIAWGVMGKLLSGEYRAAKQEGCV
ncbi:hypothetical protein CJ260_00670 [Megasphaera sp. ASD88]|uniref:hypothetical protein n=1 Tax=Megasphaera sp. ASD88 TaxID=2027407 RepID=UPI000BAC0D26|nr:hypothetical protein [Megasphaera sp. ASD88]PAV39985.1 hypothetical protein CJ260_00670 [Megasphaera sp. ASD88]